MKKKNVSAFTLMELLAVIVILAIIALIAVPLTINVINNAKEKSFIDSAYGLMDGVRLLSSEQQLAEETKEVVVHFEEGTTKNADFKVSGEMPNSGTVYLSEEGKIELKAWSEELEKCAEKSVNESEIKLTETAKENCKIDICPLVTIMGKTFRTCDTMKNDPDKNLRYVGVDPDNYVSFNNELWRIIGVFDGQTKIIRDENYATQIAWNSAGLNNWETSSLQLAFNNTTDGYIKTIETNDPTSFNYIDLNHTWDLGASIATESERTRVNFYNYERSETTAGAEGSKNTWTGAIALMYASDYAYSTNGKISECDKTTYQWDGTLYTECAKKTWLLDSKYHQWTLTARSDSTSNAFYVYNTGSISNRSVSSTSIKSGLFTKHYSVRPALYLKPNVQIVDGNGTIDQPFLLEMN